MIAVRKSAIITFHVRGLIMKRFTKVRRILALSLVLAMSFGGTVFASDSNTALVNATYQQLASRGTYTYTNASELSRFVQLGYACNQPQHQGPFSITQGTLTTSHPRQSMSSPYPVRILMSKLSPPVTGRIFWSALSRTTNISRMSETLSFPTFQRGPTLSLPDTV